MDSETHEIVEDFKDSVRPDGLALELLKELKEQNDRMDKHNKRLICANKVSTIVIAVLVLAFLFYLSRYDEIVVDSNGGGYASYIGNDGDVNNYGTNYSTETEGEHQEQESASED